MKVPTPKKKKSMDGPETKKQGQMKMMAKEHKKAGYKMKPKDGDVC
jgi:hypothetical protein